MGTVLFESPVFGPVQSRRLGVSLGINLMPADAKICTFDCIYCECGRNAERRSASKRPTRADVKCALELTLQKMQADGIVPNVITFAGNGEPTAHPCFAAIIDDTIELRNRYFPNAKISVLSNATRLNNDDVFQALLKVDNNIQKLDTVNPDYIKMVDCPVGNYHLPDVIDALVRFNGKVIIQTMFHRPAFRSEYSERVFLFTMSFTAFGDSEDIMQLCCSRPYCFRRCSCADSL